ncbi:hypothetical protein [uncultured Desulfovibrio sp.]|uniref:hypothetical protein n=1 Tax=uncultured Desulfovibrio sp. TaxID=167968 RepID=UPI00263644D2|nr:hypothetical protein [uncultured Desulfovibrio sp.]
MSFVALVSGGPARRRSVPGPRKLAARAALRAVWRQCMNGAGNRREVRTCPARESCPLWHCRFGVHPQTYKAVRRRFFAPKALRLF